MKKFGKFLSVVAFLIPGIIGAILIASNNKIMSSTGFFAIGLIIISVISFLARLFTLNSSKRIKNLLGDEYANSPEQLIIKGFTSAIKEINEAENNAELNKIKNSKRKE